MSPANRRIRILCLVNASLFLVLSGAPLASGESCEMYVSASAIAVSAEKLNAAPDNPISAAIAKSEDGCVIYVESGIYEGPVHVNKSVVFKGDDAIVLVADHGGAGFIVTAGVVKIQGFTFKGESDLLEARDPPVGIMVLDLAKEVEISNSRFNDLVVGVEVITSASVIVSDSILSQNMFGISSVNNEGEIRATKNEISENDVGLLSIHGNLTATHNSILSNQVGIQIACRVDEWHRSSIDLEFNTVNSNAIAGIWLDNHCTEFATVVDLGEGEGSGGSNDLTGNGVPILTGSP